MEISHYNDCYQNIKNKWRFTQDEIYFSERNCVNSIQVTNYASLELWLLIMENKS